ncbi:MAG: hypothetical protein Q8M26_12010 [Pseudolabrys sp.]|nr:hypothetical protein [Pseudolabrys sp.]
MASDDKKTKAVPAPKAENAAGKETPKKAEGKVDGKTDTKAAAEPVTAEAEKTADAPSNYSRGEGQKAVTQAYKDNWNAIYGNPAKKPARKPARKPASRPAKKTAKKTTKKKKR